MQTKLVLKQQSALKLRFQAGATGPAGTVEILDTITGAPGTDADVVNSGTPTAAELTFTIPRGDVGPANELSIGTVTTGAPGSSASASITGTPPSQTLNLTIPRGDVGATGPAVSDGDKGDITVSSAGTDWTIDNDAVTNAKLANVATGTLKGRATAGTGDPEDLAPAQARSVLQVDLWNRPRNRLVNNSMRVSQERGTTLVDCTTAITVAIDQVRAVLSTTPGGTLRAQQTAGTTPNGAGYYLRLTVQASDASLSAGDYYGVDFPIEGSDLSDTLQGTASAVQIVKGFWVRSSLAGTFGMAFQNGGAGRSYVQTFTIGGGEVNTWVRRTFVVPGSTSGTWPTDATLGARAILTLASGATFQGTAGSWQSSDVRTTSSQTNFMGTASATFDIAEVGLWVDHGGTGIVPSWDLPSYSDDLTRCQRYYEIGRGRIDSYATASLQGTGGYINFKANKRNASYSVGLGYDAGFINLAGTLSYDKSAESVIVTDVASAAGVCRANFSWSANARF